METALIDSTQTTNLPNEMYQPKGFTRVLNLSKLIAARIRLEDVEDAVCKGQRALHITLPKGQM